MLYVKGIAERNKEEDYKSRLKKEVNIDDNTKRFKQFLDTIQQKSVGKEFRFTPAAVDRLVELHKHIVIQGFTHSEKGANFTKMIDFTLQDFFVKLSCIIAAVYGMFDVDVIHVELAFMDLMEFFSMQLNFIKDKVKGKLDYGEGWQGATGKDQQCLEWLYDQGAVSETDGNISIKEFKKKIAEIKGVSYDEDGEGGMAPKHYNRFKENGWIDSKQIGQYSSKVWLTFKPKYNNSKFIIQDGKGVTTYNYICSNLDKIKSQLEELSSLQPLQS